MRPKRPVRPAPAPPPPPAVVKPEDLDAINTPEVDKLPAYISVGKFQWKPPLPGPKGDTGTPGAPGAPGAPGTPGEPGATVRPIDPPVTTDEIGNAQVTPEKLSFTPVARPLTPPVTTDEIGDGQVTPAKLSFTPPGITRPITPPIATDEIADSAVIASKIAANSITAGKIASGAVGASEIQSGAVSTDELANASVTQEKLAPGVGGNRIVFLPTRVQMTSLIVMGNQDWIPMPPSPGVPPEATALILQVELINNLDGQTGFINCRIRRDATQVECLVLGVDSTYPGMITGAQAMVPIVSQSFEYSFSEFYGVVNVTFNPYVVGYIM